jgi:hypothetical protein
VGRASSAKKIAKTAEKGRTQKARQSGGRVFPVALVAAVVLGALLVGYGRNSARALANVAPKPRLGDAPGDHWHVAFGVYACDKFLGNIAKVNEPDDVASGGAVAGSEYNAVGIHSHGDGVVHVHPASGGAGRKAKLGTYFRMVGVKISDDKLELPEGLGTFKKGDDCGGKPGSLKVLVWDNADDVGEPKKYFTNFKDVRFKNDHMAITVAFVNEDTDVNSLKPPSAANLAELGAADGGAAPTVTSETSIVTVGDSSSTTVAGGDTSSTTAASTTSSSS